MQLKRIGIATAIVVAGLVEAHPCVQGDRVGAFDRFTKHARADTGTGSGGNSDSFKQGRRTDWFDLYTEGMGSPVIGPQWIPGKM
ncbi:hypothetical protein PWP93_28020 [Paraburkholderia sp. A1RI-2L]|uniref:hypothetical protein n=1 Tax=Paraburkholderia sp. A1RI-2L TaxID=3028367 RepID=UPI003B7D3ADD